MNRSESDRVALRNLVAPGATVDGLSLHAIADADLAFAFDLYAQVRAAELAPVPWPEAAKRAFLLEQASLQHQHYVANYPGADLLLIEDAGVPIGRVYVYRSPGEIRLMDIALIAARRNGGIGTRLLYVLMREAAAAGSKITLHVEPDNPARRLYLRLGFHLLEQRGVYDFLGWEPEASPAN
ncbi:MAG TPA: GNAT family N-acetyltransferase [Rudaea sp.]|nr:GNAT family N-acetyltransferase [Rudaea sp.]